MKNKIVRLATRPQYRDELLSSIEKSFHYSSNNQFETDFYPLIRPDNSNNSFLLLTPEDKLVGHIGCTPRTMRIEDREHPVTLMGGIFIQEEYRGKGLFTDFFIEILSQYLSKSALIFLWSDKPDLYKKFGFGLTVGQYETIPSGSNKAKGLTKTKYCDLTPAEQKEIQAIYSGMQKFYLMPSRGESDWESIGRITSSDFFIKKNVSGHIEFYFVMNKGHDLNDIVHEFGYLDEAAKSELLTQLTLRKTYLPEALEFKTLSKQLTFGTIARVGEANLFSKFVRDHTQGHIEITTIKDSVIGFKYEGESFIRSHNEFLNAILGPNIIDELREVVKPPFISGLDSV